MDIVVVGDARIWNVCSFMVNIEFVLAGVLVCGCLCMHCDHYQLLRENAPGLAS